jgi:hypothetical protein
MILVRTDHPCLRVGCHSCLVVCLYLAAKPSHVEVDVDWIACPLHYPTACSHQTRGQALLPHVVLSRLWQNHLGKGFIARINLSDSRRRKNTINTHKHNSMYWSSSWSYYILGSCISYIEEVWSQNYAPGDKSEFANAISLNGKNILFALKENAIHQHSKPKDPCTESNPPRFGLPTNNPHQHRRQEEAAPHLHTEDNKRKAWATTLSRTYPRWPKYHL